MPRTLACTSFLVPDYDEAIAFFTQALRFDLLEDTPLAPGKRWVRVAPGPAGGTLLLARAATPQQQALIGQQGGGRVWLFLQTDAFEADVAHMRAHGVQFMETPRSEPYGRVVVFADPWGNRWDLIEPLAHG
jgi:catechol 2,3-dioxygenase-like lactoylglutathione lyase family enzyme